MVLIQVRRKRGSRNFSPKIENVVRFRTTDGYELEIITEANAPDNTVTIPLGDYTCYLPLAGMVDLAQEKEWLAKESAG